ncbi:MAG: HDIG domain-containing protein [Methanomicrobiales archaeon]|nr:HDIG domain-containing protein [Methanomicrobiales archaeon]
MCSPGDKYIPFLIKAGCDPEVIAHCLVVRDVAVQITTDLLNAGISIDLDLVAAGAVLHDIGRSQTHGMDHADAGGIICRNLGFDDKICGIVENHIGAGLSAEERVTYGLLAVDRIPKTLEEKIVAHADNMVKGKREINRQEFLASLDKFPEEIRTRFLAIADELEMLKGEGKVGV